MRYVLSVLFVAVVPYVAPRSRNMQAETDLAALQGAWFLNAVEWNGEETEQMHSANEVDPWWSFHDGLAELREVPRDPTKYRLTLTIKDDRFLVRQGGRVTSEGRFRLDATKQPAVMERTGKFYRSHCCNEGCIFWCDERRLYCIYTLDNNTLKWCFRDPRDPKSLPRDFITHDDDSLYVLTFHREEA